MNGMQAFISKRPPSTSKGLTMVEILVALAINAFVLVLLVQLFINTKATYNAQDALARLQENGRFAIEFLNRDIRRAGLWGCAPADSVANGLNDLDNAGFVFTDVTGAFGPAGNTLGISGLDADMADGLAGPAGLPQSDSITIAGAIGSPTPLVTPGMTGTAAAIPVNANGFANGAIAIVSDCRQADLFQVTDSMPSGGNTLLSHSTTSPADAPAGAPANQSGALTAVYGTQAQVYRARSLTYALGMSGGRPVLNRIGGTTSALIQGVENMRIVYGEDTDGDSTANRYVPADNVTDMAQVVSVRISLLLSTQAQILNNPKAITFDGMTVTPADRRARRVFTTTITLRNRTT